jgi:ATP-binding cassette, subfamily B, bacterial PglK
MLLILLALVSSGFEILGAALVYLLITLIAEPGAEASLPLLGNVTEMAGLEEETFLLGLAALMGGFFLLRAIVHVGEFYLQNRVGHTAGARLATRLVEGYLLMPYAFHLQRSSSDLIRNSHQAVSELVTQIFIPMIRVAASTILVIAMLAFLFAIAPAATGMAILVIGGTAVLMLHFVQPQLKRLGKVRHQTERETLRNLQEALHSIRDIKILGRERSFARRYRKARVRLARANYLGSTASDLPKTIMELALLGFILLVFVTAIAMGEGSEGTLSMLGLFAYAGLRIQPSLQKIVAGLNKLKFATAPLDDLHHDLLAIESLESSEEDVDQLAFRHELKLQDVSFRYEGADVDALKGIDLVVRPGEVIGICGPTGGGKTTLMDIATGLLPPSSGLVTVDGQDLRAHARSWYRGLGVVPQMVGLTDESLRRNIAFGLAKADIDEAAVDEAVELAQLRDFIDSLPNGLDTVVGERGVRISGGQRQRLAIARALYRRPDVLIFDEGTSALDNTTERELMRALERLRGERTILLVAHRLTTVREADRIVFVQKGRCTGQGTYDELLASHADFRALAAT